MKQVNLTLSTAILLYNSGEAGKAFALDNYTKEELEAKELPKTWKDLDTIKGFSVLSNSTTTYNDCGAVKHNTNVFATKEQAEASIAIAQLSQLMKVYNDGWIPDWSDSNFKSVIEYSRNKIITGEYINTHKFLVFKTPKIRNEFLKNFEDLILIAKPLLG